MDAIYTEEYCGFDIKVYLDEYYDSDMDEYATDFVLFHRNYRLKNDLDISKPDTIDELIQEIKDICGDDLLDMQEVYFYEHAGYSLTRSRTCRFDSSFIGYQVARKSRLEKYGMQTDAESVELAMNGDFKTYDAIISGDIYGFKVETKNEAFELDSCWGYLGRESIDEQIIPEAKIAIDNFWAEHNELVSCQNCLAGAISFEKVTYSPSVSPQQLLSIEDDDIRMIFDSFLSEEVVARCSVCNNPKPHQTIADIIDKIYK